MGAAKTYAKGTSGVSKLKAVAPKVRSNSTNGPVSVKPMLKAKGGKG